MTASLSSSPIAALTGGRLVVGVDLEAGGSARVYLDARYLDRHTHVQPPAATDVVAAWHGTLGHLWLSGVSDDVLCDCPAPVTP